MGKHKSAKNIERKETGGHGAVAGHMHNELGKLEGHAMKRHHRDY